LEHIAEESNASSLTGGRIVERNMDEAVNAYRFISTSVCGACPREYRIALNYAKINTGR
jgi:hypothetical protein